MSSVTSPISPDPTPPRASPRSGPASERTLGSVATSKILPKSKPPFPAEPAIDFPALAPINPSAPPFIAPSTPPSSIAPPIAPEAAANGTVIAW